MNALRNYIKHHPSTARLALMLSLFFGLPTAVFAYLGFAATGILKERSQEQVIKHAESVVQIIDRNLFERYGDVQAFGLNRVVLDKTTWYRPDDTNAVARVMNEYVDTYDLYSLMILVDLDGKVVAVNSKDSQGKEIATASLYAKSYANSPWFKALKEGAYTTKKLWTDPGNDVATGTFVEEVQIDPDVKASYSSQDALTIGFSAPVRGLDGKVIGYWSNRAKFSIVEDVLKSTYEQMKESGVPTAAFRVVQNDGVLLAHYDPSAANSAEFVHDYGALLRSNLITQGWPLAKASVPEHEGGLQFVDTTTGKERYGVFHHFLGALGYPGMDWAIMIDLPVEDLDPGAATIERNQKLAEFGLLGLFLPIGWLLLRKTGKAEVEAADGRARELEQKLQMGRVSAIVEDSPNAVMLCDKDDDFKITYVNPATKRLLAKLQEHLAVSADRIIGTSIDVFHKNPSHQRRILNDPKNLPFSTRIKMGKETVALNIYALYDGDKYLGPALSWELITERAAMEERDAHAKHAVSVVRESLNKVANGDMDAIITEEFDGELNTMRDNVNRIATVLTQFNTELSELSRAAQEGRLDTRANASQFAGAYADVINSVNDVLDSVLGPVRKIREQLGSVARGDLTAYVNEDYAGEHAALRDALNLSLDGLNELLGQVSTATNQISSSSTQVAAAAQDLSQGASEQAATVEEISAQMAQITAQTQQNADHATQANQLAVAARDGARVGDRRMNEMLTAMREIEDASTSISKIIKVIDEIAFQTNLLALNAAVEAARAGVHGKGFAVVAEEVRNLAARSARAAKETTEMIEGSIKKVTLGTSIAKDTATALASIVTDVGKVSDLVAEIAAASTEQADGINQINTGLEQVNQVTQRNTATAEESAASAEEMSGQAAEMQRMVGRFTLQKGRDGGKFSLDNLPPELMAELQRHMQRFGGSQPHNDSKSHAASATRPRPAAAAGGRKAGGPVIALDSDEFGRY
jgi:methyl-accepting chemotaxis protein/PAS domain-containing protein